MPNHRAGTHHLLRCEVPRSSLTVVRPALRFPLPIRTGPRRSQEAQKRLVSLDLVSGTRPALAGLPVRLSGPIPGDYLAWPLHERAVLLLGHPTGTYVTVSKMIPIPNRAPDRIRHVTLKTSDVIKACRHWPELTVLGYVHSHISDNPEPSLTDLAGLPDDWIGGVWFQGEITWYSRSA